MFFMHIEYRQNFGEDVSETSCHQRYLLSGNNNLVIFDHEIVAETRRKERLAAQNP